MHDQFRSVINQTNPHEDRCNEQNIFTKGKQELFPISPTTRIGVTTFKPVSEIKDFRFPISPTTRIGVTTLLNYACDDYWVFPISPTTRIGVTSNPPLSVKILKSLQ